VASVKVLGLVYDVDGALQVGSVRRQWLWLRAMLSRAPCDRRSVLGMPWLVQELLAGRPDAPVAYLTALPGALAGPVGRLLTRDGYPPGRLLTGWARAPWWLVGGGRRSKRAALDRLLAASPNVRWVLVGDDGGPDPASFADLARRAPGRVAAIGLRQMLESCGPRTLPRSECVHGVPVVCAPNGMELLSALRAAAGVEPPRPGEASSWFLRSAERGNDATRLRAWTEGNAVRLLVDGASYFSVFAEVLARAGAGDYVLFGGWRGDGEELLSPCGPTIVQALDRAAERGAVVRGLLWRSHSSALGWHLAANRNLAATVNAQGGEVLLDQRVRALGSHHQKAVAVRHPRHPRDDVAFVGGIDLARGRRDDADHAGDPQPVAASAHYGETPAEHDVQVEVRGPAVREIDDVLRERWEDPGPLSRLPWQVLDDRLRGLPRAAAALPPAASDPPRAGTCSVQILRTYPRRRPRLPYAPRGERSIALAYAKALSRAQRLVYVEDQYLWSMDVARIFAAALQRAPRLQLVAVVPRYPDVEKRLYLEAARLGHGEALAMVREAGGDRVQVLDVENHQGRPVYVHAKLCVVDDVWALVGSANLNVRSWTHDSEVAVAVYDDERDPRTPADPGGLGDGARRFARELRLQLMREHLDLPDLADAALLDPDEAAAEVRNSAATLEAWCRRGGRGPRPPGRLRPHIIGSSDETPPAWHRWLTGPAYRMFLDPDGRPLGMRLRRTY
jgi:phosphatidylserine/phosphatidylglycerophosphate/cardiolipin synthase-like enzyme